MVKLLILRHGHSTSNLDKTFTGQLDAPLTDIGLKQAQAVSNYIYKNYKIDAIYSSDLSRAINTIKPLSELIGLDINTDKNLREIYGGKWEGQVLDELQYKYPVEYKKWKEYDKDMRPVDGESMEELMLRAINCLKKIAMQNKDKTIVIATHGGFIKALEGAIKDLSVDKLNQLSYLSNATIMELEYNDEKFRIVQGCIENYLGDLVTEMPKGV